MSTLLNAILLQSYLGLTGLDFNVECFDICSTRLVVDVLQTAQCNAFAKLFALVVDVLLTAQCNALAKLFTG